MDRKILLSDDVIQLLRKGYFIVIDFGDFVCKLQRYDLDEQIKDEFEQEEIIFKPDFKKERNEERNSGRKNKET